VKFITISAADPLNLAGIVVPGERVPAISGKYLSFKDGALVDTPETPVLSMVGRV
jgi:ATP-dependent helicase Lhr and Lhr-like helicase